MASRVLAVFICISFWLIVSCTVHAIKLVADCPEYVDDGDALNCTCRPENSRIPATVTWPGHSNNAALGLENVSRDDNGKNFTCRVVQGGLTTEDVYTLNVAYGPSNDIIITRPPSFVTDGSRSFNLTCTANEVNPAPIYRWVGVTCRNGNGGSTCSYRPEPVLDDGNVVTCRAFNPSGRAVMSASANFTVSLSYPPSNAPSIQGFTPGEDLRSGDNVTCVVTGGKPTVSRVDFSCSSPEHLDNPDDRTDAIVSSSLTIDTSHAIGVDTECTCYALWDPEPGLYAAPSVKTFHLEYKTAIFSFTANANSHSTTVEEQTQVVLKCTAFGRPAPNLTLLRPDVADFVHTVTGSQDITYTEDSVSCEEAGTYVCVATNGFPEPDSKSIQLDVKCKFNVEYICRATCGTDGEFRLKLIIGGSIAGGLCIAIVIGVIICRHRYLRYERPLPRRDEEEEENPYTSLAPQRPPSLPPGRHRGQQPQVLELYEVGQRDNDNDSDENPYDEIHARARAEKKTKKRRGICPNKKRKKKQAS
ncbi:hypothetical protein BaRGS_00035668 [Batillaria attramentaria]|uniref:Ig-like domain-containing protein n=1 Tax=Batillaria attramentaria TaxID=370345 RepID=A0ABD0JDE9_9CAEN